MQFELIARPPMQAIDFELIYKQPTMTKALKLCQTLSGKEDKEFVGPEGIVGDTAQWSRILGPAGKHNFPQDELNRFMDKAGNEAPLLWLLHSRGYALNSLRHLETKTERELRETREELAAERLKNRVLVDAINGRTA